MFGVEARSFLPNDQSDRGHLTRQREAGHRRPHAFGQQGLLEILERSCTDTGSHRSTLEDGFEIVVMVFIETTKHLGFLGTA